MAITLTHRLSGSDTSISGSSTTASISPATDGSPIALWVTTTRTTGLNPGTVTAVSGLGLTWTQVYTGSVRDAGTTALRLGLWVGTGIASSGTASLTVTGTSTGLLWQFVQMAGADTAVGLVVANIIQSSSTSAATSMSLTLPSTPTTGDAVLAAVSHAAFNEDITAGTNFTKGTNATMSTPSTCMNWEGKTVLNTTVDASWASNVGYNGVGIEVKLAPAIILDLIDGSPAIGGGGAGGTEIQLGQPQEVDPGLIDQSPELFLQQVQFPVSIAAELLDGSASVLNPKVNPRVAAPLIDQSGVISDPMVPLKITGVGSFQADTFQADAFELASGLFADGSPQLFTPQLPLVVLTPSPASSGEGFQDGAFQADTFQIGADTGIDQSGEVFTPSQILNPLAGEKTVVAPFINQSAAILATGLGSAGAVKLKVTTALIDQSAVVLTPGGSNIISFGGAVSWDSPDVLWDDPGVVWDSGAAGGGLLNQSGVVFTPKANLSIATSLIDQSGVVFAPQISGQFVRPGLIDQSCFLYTPEGIFEQVLVDLIDQSPEVYEHKTGEVQYELIDQSPEVYEPSLNSVSIFMDLLDGSGFVYTIDQITMTVVPDLIDDSGVVFAPITGPVISVGLIDQSAVVFEPSLAITVDIIDASPEIFEPVNVFTNEPHTIRLDDDPSGFIDDSPVLFAPEVDIAPPKFVFVGFIDATPSVIGFRIVVPTQNIVLLRARYAPIIRNDARYDPVIDNDAMVSQQG